MLKRLFYFLIPLLTLCATVGFSKGPEQSVPVYDFSKGLDSYHSSLSLPDGFVQDALNVYFDRTAPIEKRKGYTVAFSSKAWAYQGAWTYTDGNNTSWIIVRSSDQITASNLNGSIVKIATTSANDLVSEVNAFGNAYFVDPTNGVYYWNGTATTYVSGSPKGSLITQFHGRVWVSGAAVPNGNQLYGSKYLDGTIWTTGVNANDPVQLTVGLQDNYDNISALYPFIDTLYVLKHYSISALYGFDQPTFQIGFITAECGCIDQQSIQSFNHGLYFVSLRGVESFNGYTCTRISDPVKNRVDVAIASQGGFTTSSWIQSSQSDFSAGTLSSTTVTVSGVQLSTDNVNFSDNSFESNSWTFSAGSLGVSYTNQIGSIPTQHCGSVSAIDGSHFADINGNCQGGMALTATVFDTNTNTVVASTTTSTSTQQCGWTQFTISGLSGSIRHIGKIQITNSLDAGTLTSPTFIMSGDPITVYIQGDDTIPNLSCPHKYVDFFQGGVTDITTGTFKSQSHSLSGITTFGNFSTNQTLNNANLAYAICTSSSSNMTNAACANQAANAQISASTNAFIQVISTFTTTYSSNTAVLQSFTIQWFTGGRTPSMASTVWDNRYLLSLTTSTLDSINDAILVYSPKDVWTVFDIHAGGLTQFKNNLYHADSIGTGNVYLDEQGYADNGSAINAYIRTKDYYHGDLSQDSYIDSIYPTMDNLGTYNVSLNYYVDRSTTSFALSTVSQSEFGSNAVVKIPFPLDSSHQVFGKTFSYKFTASDLNEPWNFYGFREIFHTRPTQ